MCSPRSSSSLTRYMLGQLATRGLFCGSVISPSPWDSWHRKTATQIAGFLVCSLVAGCSKEQYTFFSLLADGVQEKERLTFFWRLSILSYAVLICLMRLLTVNKWATVKPFLLSRFKPHGPKTIFHYLCVTRTHCISDNSVYLSINKYILLLSE